MSTRPLTPTPSRSRLAASRCSSMGSPTCAISVGECVCERVCVCARVPTRTKERVEPTRTRFRNTQPTAPTCIESPAHAPPHPRAHAPTPPCSRRLRARDRERERERESRGRCSHTHTHTHTHRPRDGSCGAAEVTEEGHSRLNCFRSRGCSELFMLLEQRAAAGENGGGVRGSLVYVH